MRKTDLQLHRCRAWSVNPHQWEQGSRTQDEKGYAHNVAYLAEFLRLKPTGRLLERRVKSVKNTLGCPTALFAHPYMETLTLGFSIWQVARSCHPSRLRIKPTTHSWWKNEHIQFDISTHFQAQTSKNTSEMMIGSEHWLEHIISTSFHAIIVLCLSPTMCRPQAYVWIQSNARQGETKQNKQPENDN